MAIYFIDRKMEQTSSLLSLLRRKQAHAEARARRTKVRQVGAVLCMDTLQLGVDGKEG